MGTQAKKPNALLAAVNRAVPKDEAEPTQPAAVKAPVAKQTAAAQPAPPSKNQRPSRVGTKLIAGHFDPKIARQLRIIAAEEDTTVQALLEEALDLLFVKKGRAHIKDMGSS
ncbi:ribbon-helix-helix domain-containing protein [Salipiger abyssi]|uniref:ribbon-helix-helix domain-containing protein n=1 Tax=Salipiger abyssi TaxID=1250539 RepID=UPI0012ECB33E|nr:ribbon-helix-helix domain-containing protein [Salipiger abyssi]